MKISGSYQYDVIIIGGGVAGISAALWCRELGLKSILLESSNELGGQLLWTYNSIKNHLGIEAENGRELQKAFLKQIEPFKLDLKTNCEVSEIDVVHKRVKLANGQIFEAKSLVIATGIKRRKLNIEGEEEFKDKGILVSGKRDAEKVVGKKVCIVGGGDAAFENALILSDYADKITLIHRGKHFRSRSEFIEKVKANKRIGISNETVVTKIIGSGTLESLEIHNVATTKKSLITTDFLLLRLGVEPNTNLLKGQINLNSSGYCQVDANCQTSVENIYAIGDVASPLAPTISGAIGMGASVAKIIASCMKI